ncbi:MAG: hypothetical protein FJZ01_06750 [Candidatus Sericytochromatia bacterium]|nr:hypothetical protein [Candidatus Tanganyikabacteria bacterium]
MDAEVRIELAEGLRRAADLLAEGPVDSPRRKEILRAAEAVRNALLGMGFDEGASRRRVVSFLRSVSLANGVIGKRTASRLCHRTFEEDAEAALKWLLEKGYIEDAGSEGFQLTETGYQYLDTHKAEIAPPAAERKGHGTSRPRSSRSSRDAKAPAIPAVMAATALAPAPEAAPAEPAAVAPPAEAVAEAAPTAAVASAE